MQNWRKCLASQAGKLPLHECIIIEINNSSASLSSSLQRCNWKILNFIVPRRDNFTQKLFSHSFRGRKCKNNYFLCRPISFFASLHVLCSVSLLYHPSRRCFSLAKKGFSKWKILVRFRVTKSRGISLVFSWECRGI